MGMLLKILFLILGLVICFILFIPLKGVYSRDLLNMENQLVEVEKTLTFSVNEHNNLLQQEGLPYITLTNTDNSSGYFKVILWSVSENDKDYRNYINSTEYVGELVSQHAEDYINRDAIISFEDFIDRLPQHNKIEWTGRLLPMQEIKVVYPNIDDVFAYNYDMWDWGYKIESTSIKKSMEPQLVPKMVFTYVPLVTYWSGSNAANWISNSIFYAILAFIVLFILYKLLKRYLI